MIVFIATCMVGYEEICREIILCKNENIRFKPDTVVKHDFTCVVESLTAKIGFIKIEEMVPILMNLKSKVIESSFMERKRIIESVLYQAVEANNMISGAFFSNKIEEPLKTNA